MQTECAAIRDEVSPTMALLMAESVRCRLENVPAPLTSGALPKRPAGIRPFAGRGDLGGVGVRVFGSVSEGTSSNDTFSSWCGR